MAIALDRIKNIKGVKSELDIQEQKARIKKLEKEVKGSGEIDNNSYGVVKMPNVVPLVPPPIEVNDNE